MTYKRRTEITIETHSLTIIRTRNANCVYCRNCQANVTTFRRAHAALIFRAAPAEIERLWQINSIHTTDEGDALCGNSLAGHFKQKIRYVED